MTNTETNSSKVIGTKEVGVTYTERRAVRVVTFNTAGEIAIIYAKRDNYYKLPGGGIDPGEDHVVAVEREMQEETGALIKVRDAGCIATTEEYRNDLHQISYCYSADLVNDAGAPNLTEDEIQDKLQHQWLPVEEAKKLMAAAEPTSKLGQYIKERDIYLLDEATK
jgi:8-oxo-dGTP diphosphatase